MPIRSAMGFVWPSRVQSLREQLASADVEQRRVAMRDVQGNYSALMEPLVSVAFEDTDREVRILAARVTLQQELPIWAPLIAWLGQSSDAELRLLAAEGLARVPNASAEVALVRACNDEDVRVRRAATLALDRYPYPASKPALVRASADPDAQVRRYATRALSKYDDPQSQAALTLRVNDADPQVRATVLGALGVQLRFDQNHRVPVVIRAALDDIDSNVRVAALQSAGEFVAVGQDVNDARLTLQLVKEGQPLHEVQAALQTVSGLRSTVIAQELYARWASTSDLRLKRAIADWVGQTPYYADEVPSICLSNAANDGKRDCLSLYGRASHDASAVMRYARTAPLPDEAVLAALAAIGDVSTLNWICGHLGSRRAVVAQAARAALAATLDVRGSGSALDPLLALLSRMPVPSSERTEVIRLISMTRSPRAYPTIERLLERANTTHDEQLLLIQALGLLNSSESERRLSQIVVQSEPSLALASAEILYATSSGRQLPELLERLARGSANRDALLLAISGLLARTSDPGAIDRASELFLTLYADERDAFLEGFARNPDPRAWQWIVRFIAQASEPDLGKIAESTNVLDARSAVLVQLAHHPSLQVRLNALWSLGRATTDFAEPTLHEAVSDPEPRVRANALVSLGRGGKRFHRAVTSTLCPTIQDREPLIRQAALIGLLASEQRCDDGRERLLLLSDSDERVRYTAALAVAKSQLRSPNAHDAQALRYCRTFETIESIRQRCAFGGAGLEPGSLPIAQGSKGALLIASDYRLSAHELAGQVIGLELPEGLIRIAVLDRRGALFEPSIDPRNARLLPVQLRR